MYVLALWLLLLLVLLPKTVTCYVTDLKLAICDNKQFACPYNPGYQRIPIDLNVGTLLPKSVYLDLKEDPISDPITDIKIVKQTDEGQQRALKNNKSWTQLNGNLNEGGTDDTTLTLYYTKDLKISKNPITSIIVKTGSHPVVSADYVRIPINLNQGVGGESLYMFHSQAGSKGKKKEIKFLLFYAKRGRDIGCRFTFVD